MSTITFSPMKITNYSIDIEYGSLTKARDLIGSALQSEGSGKTLDWQVVQANHKKFAFCDTLVLAVLVDTFRSAAYWLQYQRENYLPERRKGEIESFRQAYALVSGTGLEKMITMLQINYDANLLRTHFYQIFAIEELS